MKPRAPRPPPGFRQQGWIVLCVAAALFGISASWTDPPPRPAPICGAAGP